MENFTTRNFVQGNTNIRAALSSTDVIEVGQKGKAASQFDSSIVELVVETPLHFKDIISVFLFVISASNTRSAQNGA